MSYYLLILLRLKRLQIVTKEKEDKVCSPEKERKKATKKSELVFVGAYALNYYVNTLRISARLKMRVCSKKDIFYYCH